MAGQKLRPGKTGHTPPRTEPWTEERVVEALFAFYKEHKRWPLGNWDWRTHKGLPSPWLATRLINPDHYPYWRGTRERRSWERSPWRRPWDAFQVLLAEDERCTAEMAFQFPNALARSAAFRRIGFDNLVKAGVDVGVIDRHPQLGTLYRIPGERPDEPMHIVRVKNSTPEPDGTYAEYYLRVPPGIWRVRDALAWTFHLDRHNSPRYRPLIET